MPLVDTLTTSVVHKVIIVYEQKWHVSKNAEQSTTKKISRAVPTYVAISLYGKIYTAEDKCYIALAHKLTVSNLEGNWLFE